MNTISFLFKQLVIIAYLYCLKIMAALGYKQEKPLTKSTITMENEFVNKKLNRFLELLRNSEKNDIYNQNIDPIIYNKAAYDEYLSSPETTLMENKWKSRKIIINTPRGNIMMHYDVYKMAFSYFCDQSNLSNGILNACAMEYVTRYRCLNFYVDEMTSPNFNENEIIKIHYLNPSVASTVIKKPSMIATSVVKKTEAINMKKRPTLKNRFVHLGKISNMELLPPKKKENPLNGFFSELMEDLDISEEKDTKPVKKPELSYEEYKKMMAEKDK